MDINRIKDAIKSGRINITEHADEELANYEISNESLYYSVLHGEIIEEYPDDYLEETHRADLFTVCGRMQVNQTSPY